jgi:hypothetical protein
MKVAAGAIGLGTAGSLYPSGGVTLGHALLVAILPVVMAAAWRFKQARICLVLLGLWALSTALTEVATHDSLKNAVYALSHPLTLVLSFCGGLWIFQHGSAATRVYAGSLVVGLAGAVMAVPTNLTVDPWKYGFGPIASLAVVLVSATLLRHGKVLSAGILLAIDAAVNLKLGFRSEFLVVSLTGAVGLLIARRTPGLSWKRCALIGAALCAIIPGVYVSYGHLASSGQLGTEQQVKWDRQSAVAGGLLVGGRPEFLASGAIIEESPLMGRGVAPYADAETRAAFLHRLRALGVEPHSGVSTPCSSSCGPNRESWPSPVCWPRCFSSSRLCSAQCARGRGHPY